LSPNGWPFADPKMGVNMAILMEIQGIEKVNRRR
jgi:hypothetical protein